MINNVALKFAASTLVLGVTMVGCKPASYAYRPATLSSKAPKAEQEAARLDGKAQELAKKSQFAEALKLEEKAVELSPRDVAYRMVLADLYVKNGRFASAESTYADVVSLNPDNGRAALSLALAQIALGKNYQAITTLDRLAQTAAPTDVGLAYALAGQPQRAIEMLEPAARAADAGARARQNLALAYALAGDWQRARMIAAQDVPAAELSQRMQQWASFTNPSTSFDQVASLLGVTPAADAGQPVRLALAPAAPEVAENSFAESPAPESTPVAAIAAPEVAYVTPPAPAIETAVANSAPAEPVPVQPMPAQSAENVPTVEVPATDFAQVVKTLVDPQPAIVRAATPVANVSLPAFLPAKTAPRIAGRSEKAAERILQARQGGRFVVQLGAFKSAAQVETAWARAYRRYAIANHVPLSTTVTVPGKGTFHRLSVSGFDTQREAARACGSIRAKGGACFVRANAGDAPVRWASRYPSHRA